MTDTPPVEVPAVWLLEQDPAMSPAKLMLLLYYAQGSHLALYGTPLFDADIYATKTSVTIPDLVVPLPKDTDASSLRPSAKAVLRSIYDALGPIPASDLAVSIRKEAPWTDAAGNL